MKNKHDFSKGIRGKFYNADAEFNLPIYLEPEIEEFIRKLTKEKKCRNKPNRQSTFAERYGNHWI